MSGDFGPHSSIPAAIKALEQHAHVHLQLVGDQRALSVDQIPSNRCDIVHAPQGCPPDRSVASVLRGDQTSSLHRCMQLVGEGTADALVSAASSGALMALGRRTLSMIPGLTRPALCAPLPTLKHAAYLLDLGANVDVDAPALLEYARLGSALVTTLRSLPRPQVALLSNGAEAGKGNTVIREAAEILAAAHDIEYAGFVEGDQLFSTTADVIVCDGLLGNVALKAAEGTARYAAQVVNDSIAAHAAAAATQDGMAEALSSIHSRLCDQRHGGAFLLGLNRVVVKCHGGAAAQGFEAAISKAASCVNDGIVDHLKQRLTQLENGNHD